MSVLLPHSETVWRSYPNWITRSFWWPQLLTASVSQVWLVASVYVKIISVSNWWLWSEQGETSLKHMLWMQYSAIPHFTTDVCDEFHDIHNTVQVCLPLEIRNDHCCHV